MRLLLDYLFNVGPQCRRHSKTMSSCNISSSSSSSSSRSRSRSSSSSSSSSSSRGGGSSSSSSSSSSRSRSRGGKAELSCKHWTTNNNPGHFATAVGCNKALLSGCFVERLSVLISFPAIPTAITTFVSIHGLGFCASNQKRLFHTQPSSQLQPTLATTVDTTKVCR